MLVALTALLLAPFLGKPLSVDDPPYVWGARQVAVHPFDPYGFTGNWAGFAQPFWRFMQNPPGLFYYLAAVARVGGWGEASLHAGLLPVAVLTAVGTYLLAAAFCRRPLAAALLAVASPAFVVSATTVMCDVPLLGLWVWSVLLWTWGAAEDRPARACGWLALSAVTATGAVLTKYPGVDLVPLLAAHAVLCPARRRRTRAVQALVLLVPVAALIGWDRASAARYGVGLVGDAVAYSRRVSAGARFSTAARAANAVCFVGGGGLTAAAVAVAAFVGRGRRVRRGLAVAAAAVVLGGVGATLCPPPAGWGRAGGPPAWAYFAQYGGLAAAGVATLACCGVGVRHGDGRGGWFLLSWVGGVFVFASAMNWTVNVRSLLPLVPPVCILTVRAADRIRARAGPLAWAAAAAAGVSVAVAVAEYRVGVVNRDVAAEVTAAHAGSRVWFGGHWGFQYYMAAGGATPLDASGPAPAAGDVVVVPLDNDGSAARPDPAAVVARVAVGNGYWLTTMNDPMGGGFYSSAGDRLPFVFGPVPPETFVLARVHP